MDKTMEKPAAKPEVKPEVKPEAKPELDKRVLEDVENVLKEQLESVGVVDGRQLGGVDLVASILNQMDRTLETELLGRLEEANPDLAEKIRQLGRIDALFIQRQDVVAGRRA